MELLLDGRVFRLSSLLGLKYAEQVMTQQTLDDLVAPAWESYQTYQTRGWTKRWVEQQVVMDVQGLAHGTVHGTADIIHLYPEALDVSDWKFGFVPVHFDQLYFYAAAAIDTLDELAGLPLDFPIQLQVYQPRVQREPIMKTTTVEGLNVWRKQYSSALHEARRISPRLSLGSHCTFCPASVVCPEAQGVVESIVTFNPPVMSIEDLSDAATKAAVAKTAVTEIESHLKQSLLAGVASPLYALKPGRRAYRWADPAEAQAVIQGLLGEACMEPAQLKSVAAVRQMLTAEGRTRAEASDILNPLVVESRVQPSVVRREEMGEEPADGAALEVDMALAAKLARGFNFGGR